ncbi:MAG: photosystem II reaction center protein PsbN [Fimbriimonadaceae bacterium]|nr:photosystem II reaction center protein PsbN [Fimbriimonadaceae bacterium]
MNDDSKKLTWTIIAAIAVLVAGFSIYRSFAPPAEESIGTLDIQKEGAPRGATRGPTDLPKEPAKQAQTTNPDAGDILSGAPPDAIPPGG